MNMQLFFFLCLLHFLQALDNHYTSNKVTNNVNITDYNSVWNLYYQQLKGTRGDVNLLAAVGSPLPPDIRLVTGPFGTYGRPAVELNPNSYVGRWAKDLIPHPFYRNFGIKVTLYLKSEAGGVLFSILTEDHSSEIFGLSILKAKKGKQEIEVNYGDKSIVFSLPLFVHMWTVFSLAFNGDEVTLYFNGCQHTRTANFKPPRQQLRLQPESPLFVGRAGWLIQKPKLFGVVYDLTILKSVDKAVPTCGKEINQVDVPAKDARFLPTKYPTTSQTQDLLRNNIDLAKKLLREENEKISNTLDLIEEPLDATQKTTTEARTTTTESTTTTAEPTTTSTESTTTLATTRKPTTTTRKPTTTTAESIATARKPTTTRAESTATTRKPTTELTTTTAEPTTTTTQSTTTTAEPTTESTTKTAEPTTTTKEPKTMATEPTTIKKTVESELISYKIEEEVHLETIASGPTIAEFEDNDEGIGKGQMTNMLKKENIKDRPCEKEGGQMRAPQQSAQNKDNSKAIVMLDRQDLERSAEMFEVGTFVFVSSRDELYIRSLLGWLQIQTKKEDVEEPLYDEAAFDLADKPYQQPALSVEEQMMLKNFDMLPPGIYPKRPYLLVVALNEPLDGRMGGVVGADFLCYKQAERSRLHGSQFRSLLSTSFQSIKYMYSRMHSHLPVVNLKGEQLLESWSATFNSSRYNIFNPRTKIFSFQMKSVLDDDRWPLKKVWHGCHADGGFYRGNSQCDAWSENSVTSYSTASSLGKFVPVFNEERVSCDQKLAVLCAQIALR